MEKDSALYQLMDTRMNGVMNGIMSGDGEYQAILRKSEEYYGRLERIGLPVDVRLLIDDYVSEQNAPVSWYGMPAYLQYYIGIYKFCIQTGKTAVLSRNLLTFA